MYSLKSIFCLFISLLILSSCAKMQYLFEQGIGQVKLLNQSRFNNELLTDKSIPQDYKRKIKLIETYKKYFYKYWQKPTSDIYSQTTILDREAVTYLVIRSSVHQVKALEECFVFMGCFPYLGFFNYDSALEYSEGKQKKGEHTWIRKVFAYSTLGYFTDDILSSFFYYDDFELAELIFHELFHTIFFIKDEVGLNENLANYIGKEMAIEYFSDKSSLVNNKITKRQNYAKINIKIVSLIKELNLKYKEVSSKQEYSNVLASFIKNRFSPEVSKLCTQIGINLTECYPLKKKWNNASLAAKMTYSQKVNKIEELRQVNNYSIRELFNFINQKHTKYKKLDLDSTFFEYLFKK